MSFPFTFALFSYQCSGSIFEDAALTQISTQLPPLMLSFDIGGWQAFIGVLKLFVGVQELIL